jgi:hypothetical protein
MSANATLTMNRSRLAMNAAVDSTASKAGYRAAGAAAEVSRPRDAAEPGGDRRRGHGIP